MVVQQVELGRQAGGEAALGDLLHDQRPQHLGRFAAVALLGGEVLLAEVPVGGEQRHDRDHPAAGLLQVVRQRVRDLRGEFAGAPAPAVGRPLADGAEPLVAAGEQQRLAGPHHRLGQLRAPLNQVRPLVDRVLPADRLHRVPPPPPPHEADPVHVQQPATLVHGDPRHVLHAPRTLEKKDGLLELAPEVPGGQVPAPLRSALLPGQVLRGVPGELLHELQKSRPRLRGAVRPLQDLQGPAGGALRDEGRGEVQVGGGEFFGRVGPVPGAALPGGERRGQQRGDGPVGPGHVAEARFGQPPLVGQGEGPGVEGPDRRGRGPQALPEHVEELGEELFGADLAAGQPFDVLGKPADPFAGLAELFGRAVRLLGSPGLSGFGNGARRRGGHGRECRAGNGGRRETAGGSARRLPRRLRGRPPRPVQSTRPAAARRSARPPFPPAASRRCPPARPSRSPCC